MFKKRCFAAQMKQKRNPNILKVIQPFSHRRKLLYRDSRICLCLGNCPACVFILPNAASESQMAAWFEQVGASVFLNPNPKLDGVDINLSASHPSVPLPAPGYAAWLNLQLFDPIRLFPSTIKVPKSASNVNTIVQAPLAFPFLCPFVLSSLN